jgi:hypothetical protein
MRRRCSIIDQASGSALPITEMHICVAPQQIERQRKTKTAKVVLLANNCYVGGSFWGTLFHRAPQTPSSMSLCSMCAATTLFVCFEASLHTDLKFKNCLHFVV